MFIFDIAQNLAQPTALYIDPSVLTGVIASISGVVIAVGAAGVILWRKAKKKAAQVFHIDENANKEVEVDIVIKDEE